MKRYIILFLVCLIFSSRIHGEEPAFSVRVSTITVRPQNVFDLGDPTQQRFLFILANRLHITTRPSFIRKQILFRQGEQFDPLLMDESERLLRDFAFLRDATVVTSMKGDEVFPQVFTHDAWSTMPEISYGTEGGENTWSVGLKEKNLLGLGKTAAVYYKKELDRTYTEFYYEDPCFILPRWEAGINLQRDGDQRSRAGYVTRPFYSSVTPWAVFGGGERSRRSVKRYVGGDETASFARDRKSAAAGLGFSLGSTPECIQRLRFGFSRLEDVYEIESMLLPGTAPVNKKITAVRISLELKRLDFYKEQYVNTFDRVEDFNPGNALFVRYGYAPKRWDGTLDRQLVSVVEKKGWRLPCGNTLFVYASVDGRIERGTASDLTKFYHLYHYLKFTRRHTLVSSISYEAGEDLSADRQLLLGGATGLRGYSIKQFSGDRKFVFNVEYRTFWLHDFMRLVSVGGILFFDSGYVWPGGTAVRRGDLKSNIGFGFRLDPTRGRGSHPFNISVAYALDDNDHDSRWVLTISGRPNLLNSIGRPKDDIFENTMGF